MDTHKLSKFRVLDTWDSGLNSSLILKWKLTNRNYFPILSGVFLAVTDYCWRQQLLPGTPAVLCQRCAQFYHFYFIVLLVFTPLKVSFYASYFHNKSLTVIKMLRQFLHELLTVGIAWHLMHFRGCTRTKRIYFGTQLPISFPLRDRRRQVREMQAKKKVMQEERPPSQQKLNLDRKTNTLIPKRVTNFKSLKYRSSKSSPCPYCLTYLMFFR